MNRSEREALAEFVSEMKYGRNTTRETSALADRMLNAFPGVKDYYIHAAEIEAAGTLIQKMLTTISSNGAVKGQENRHVFSAAEHLWDVASAFSEWCEANGTTAVKTFEDDGPLKELALNENLTKYMRNSTKYMPQLDGFVRVLENFQRA